jgi:signal transduction histidine kinase
VNSDEIVGKTVHDIYPREQAAEFAASDQEAIDSQSVMSQEIEISYPDGYTRTVISTRFPVLSSADDVIGLGTINFDITEHKRAEKAKNEFISTVSHELRTPLTSIKGSLGLIAGGALGAMSDKAKAIVEVAHQNTERLIKLVNDILDMEKIEAGRMDFHMEPVDIVSLVKSAIEANNGFCADLGVTFVQVALEEKNFVHGDRGRLMQVLSNLMSNAAKFSPHGGRVDISVTRQGDTVRIALKDSGPGIPEEFRKSIFEKFTQADSSDSRQKGGTGLGLSIAKSIVERHHGDLGCESEVGAGSTFFFTLPVSD